MADPRVAAALAAERKYLDECDARRRAKSHELHGHGEAPVPSAAPDPEERMRRILETIDAERAGERVRARYREAAAQGAAA